MALSIYFKNVDISFEMPKHSIKDKLLSRRSKYQEIIENSTKVNEKKLKALTNVNVSINDGERVGIIGANGAGKSTFLRTLAGVYIPSSGEVALNCKVTSLIDLGLGLNSDATGIENIYLRSMLLGINREQIISRTPEIVNFSGLGEFINLPIRNYSTGMLMRLAFAISTSFTPEILLMDEWLSVGDAEFNKKAEDRLLSVVSQSKVLVIATHQRELLEKVCTRAIWLEHGQIKMDGPVGEVSQAYFG